MNALKYLKYRRIPEEYRMEKVPEALKTLAFMEKIP